MLWSVIMCVDGVWWFVCLTSSQLITEVKHLPSPVDGHWSQELDSHKIPTHRTSPPILCDVETWLTQCKMDFNDGFLQLLLLPAAAASLTAALVADTGRHRYLPNAADLRYWPLPLLAVAHFYWLTLLTAARPSENWQISLTWLQFAHQH